MNETEIEMTRHPISITLPEELIKWIDEQIKAKKFYNRSHAVEVALDNMRQEKKE
jgi:Arc/MetJ-type ribon-helix-helix transcriptional regulator